LLRLPLGNCPINFFTRRRRQLAKVVVVDPIDELQQARVREATSHFILVAESLLGRAFEPPPVLFDLCGRAAGMFKVVGQDCWIRYNPWIFGKYFEENLRDTVPHEVAHFIVHRLYGCRRVKPHGPEWQALMEAFGADPGVTFDLDISGVPQRRQRSHRYLCDCREHKVSSTRHNRVLGGRATYQCRSCRGKLVYAGRGG